MAKPGIQSNEQTILIVDEHQEVTEAVAAFIAGPDRVIITASDCEAGASVIQRLQPSWVICEIHFASPFECQGFQLLDAALKASSDCRVVLLSSDQSSSLHQEALGRGAFAVLRKPADARAIRAVLGLPQEDRPGGVVYRVPPLETIIREELLAPKFQPIFELNEHGGAPFGFESLIRYTGAAPFMDPLFLFDYARRREALVEFDLVCMRRSLEEGADLSRKGKLFINVHPRLFAQCHRVNRLLNECSGRFGIPLQNIVLEITEQEILSAGEAAISCAKELKAMGLQFALDDVGMSYSHLNLIGVIEPSYLKISHSFGTTLHSSVTHEKIIRNIIALAADFDCQVIVEGIEEIATLDAAQKIGAHYGQGYFFAEPRQILDFDSTAKRRVEWHGATRS